MGCPSASWDRLGYSTKGHILLRPLSFIGSLLVTFFLIFPDGETIIWFFEGFSVGGRKVTAMKFKKADSIDSAPRS